MQDGAQLVAPCLQDLEAIASVDSLLRCRLTRIVDLYFDLELLYLIGVTSQLFGELFGAQFATLDLATLFRLAEPLIACFSPLLILRSNLASLPPICHVFEEENEGAHRKRDAKVEGEEGDGMLLTPLEHVVGLVAEHADDAHIAREGGRPITSRTTLNDLHGKLQAGEDDRPDKQITA